MCLIRTFTYFSGQELLSIFEIVPFSTSFVSGGQHSGGS
jgi:hypothetical protein